MPEMGQMVRLRKVTGGNSVEWEGRQWSWGADGSVTEVPYALALSLLQIPDGGYSVEGDTIVHAASAPAGGGVQSAHDAGLKGSAEGEGSTRGAGGQDEPEASGPVLATPTGSPVTPRPVAATGSSAGHAPARPAASKAAGSGKKE
jgi:hypothetical protein